MAAGLSLSSAPPSWRLTSESPKSQPPLVFLSMRNQNYLPTLAAKGSRGICGVIVRAAPDKIQGKVEESIKQAEETCSDDPASGECVAAWDEVEELSAAASHARDKKKSSDPLEEFCKDNPETDECRTYDN
ncbi:Calvin cycle protein CP12-1, chloroplastic [Linum grandiflorum]